MRTWWCALVVTGVLASPAATAQELVERTLVIVGGNAITLADVRTAMALALVDAGTDIERATEELVDRTLMLREVERYAPPEPDAARVEARIAEIRSRLTPAAFDAVLAEGGFTEARLRGWVRDDVRIAAYLDQRFAADGPERREALIADWLLDLRRRTPVVALKQR
jgi:hypothetical protein